MVKKHEQHFLDGLTNETNGLINFPDLMSIELTGFPRLTVSRLVVRGKTIPALKNLKNSRA